MVIGYARVSTQEQSLSRQLDMLKEKGCDEIFEERMTGTKADRPQLSRLLDKIREGDRLIIFCKAGMYAVKGGNDTATKTAWQRLICR